MDTRYGSCCPNGMYIWPSCVSRTTRKVIAESLGGRGSSWSGGMVEQCARLEMENSG